MANELLAALSANDWHPEIYLCYCAWNVSVLQWRAFDQLQWNLPTRDQPFRELGSLSQRMTSMMAPARDSNHPHMGLCTRSEVLLLSFLERQVQLEAYLGSLNPRIGFAHLTVADAKLSVPTQNLELVQHMGCPFGVPIVAVASTPDRYSRVV